MQLPNDTNFFQTLTNSPWKSVGITHCAFITGLLTYLGIITPVLGFVSVIFGCLVGYYSLRVQYSKWKNTKRK